MIGKTSVGKSFSGATRYVMHGNKQTKKEGQLLKAEGVRGESWKKAANDFERIREERPRVGNAVWHTSISFAKADQVSDRKMVEIAEKYLHKVGFENNQYLVVKHNDTSHAHIHIVANRVTYEGELVSDQFLKNRTAQACDQLEREFNLTIAKEQGRARGGIDKRAGLKQEKQAIQREVVESLKRSFSIEGLKKSLDRKQIELKEHKRASGETYGISFKRGNLPVKGSAIGLKYKEITKQIDQNVRQSSAIKNQLSSNLNDKPMKVTNETFPVQKKVEREVRESLSRSKNMVELSKSLERKGIKVEVKEMAKGTQKIEFTRGATKFEGKDLARDLTLNRVTNKLQENAAPKIEQTNKLTL